MEKIVVKNIFKSYICNDGKKKSVLENVDFSICEGEFVSLIGESGCGKSTLSRIIMGIEKADKGYVEICNQKWRNIKKDKQKILRKNIQGVFQDSSGTLNKNISTYKNVELSLKSLIDCDSFQRKEIIYSLMKRFNLSVDLLKTPVRQLSGGEQRRLSIIRAISIKPKFLILDEILSGLDLVSANMVMELLEEYKNEYGCGFLFITHDMQSAYRMSDRIFVLENGKITTTATKII